MYQSLALYLGLDQQAKQATMAERYQSSVEAVDQQLENYYKFCEKIICSSIV